MSRNAGAAADAPLLAHAVAALEQPGPPAVLGLAVSGGSDSLAMLHLMARAAPVTGWHLHAVTVDHALREGSAAEAALVGRLCAGLGVAHDSLRWDHGDITGNLQDQARRARYRLMADWAQARGIGSIALAHTADDQAETFLMGLARGAGLDGLTGMRPEWTERGVTFRRPFLALTRAELRGFLTRHGITWVDDPSNDNDRFTRVKARRALAALAPLGIGAERLGGVIRNLAAVQASLSQDVQAAAREIATELPGALALNRDGFARLPPETARRLLIAAIRWVSGADYAPRAEPLLRVLNAIAAGQDSTLHGCRFRIAGPDLRILREPRAVKGVVALPNDLWDGRWRLHGPGQAGQEVRALGAEGLGRCKDWRATGFSRDVLVVTPAVWQRETLVAAPLAGLSAGWTAQIVAGFGSFILSH